MTLEATIIALVVIYVLGLIFLPVTLWREKVKGNAKNWPGLIIMKTVLDCPGAVWAQEFYEARSRWVYCAFDIPLMILGRVIPSMGYYEKDLELMGHEVEVQAEIMIKGGSETKIRRREAESLVNNYDVFHGDSVSEVEKELLDRREEAYEFVRDHRSKIMVMHRKGKSHVSLGGRS